MLNNDSPNLVAAEAALNDTVSMAGNPKNFQLNKTDTFPKQGRANFTSGLSFLSLSCHDEPNGNVRDRNLYSSEIK